MGGANHPSIAGRRPAAARRLRSDEGRGAREGRSPPGRIGNRRTRRPESDDTRRLRGRMAPGRAEGARAGHDVCPTERALSEPRRGVAGGPRPTGSPPAGARGPAARGASRAWGLGPGSADGLCALTGGARIGRAAAEDRGQSGDRSDAAQRAEPGAARPRRGRGAEAARGGPRRSAGSALRARHDDRDAPGRAFRAPMGRPWTFAAESSL